MKKTQFFFFSFVRGSNLFWFSKCNWSSKKNRKSCRKFHILVESWYSLYFVKFHTEILWWKSIHCDSTSHNYHTELPCDLSEQHRCIIHSRLCSLCNTKIHILIPVLTSLSPSLAHDAWKRFSHSSHSTTYLIRYLAILFAKAVLKPGTWVHFDTTSKDEKSDQISSIWGFEAT